MQQERLTYLISRIADKTISAEETAELRALLNEHDETALADSGFTSWLNEQLPALDLQEEDEAMRRQVSAILSVDKAAAISTLPETVHRVYFLRKRGWVAAAVILLLAVGGYFWTVNKKNSSPATISAKTVDIAPGKKGAILTLADGSQVVLDSLSNGVIATQSGARVQLKNGQLAYDPTGELAGEIVYNTMSTPKGRQFTVLLPDGTRVWLNAASSIRYPTVFTGPERKVEISGEAYFEVAKNAKMPFRVKANDQAEIEVLGTHFNVNSYADETSIRTTLIEGSVKVTAADRNVVLKPGQQAVAGLSDRQLRIVNNADVEQVLAWKNGAFNFQDMSFPEAARQLERWYDIQVVYESQVPDIQFKGDMDRGVNLSDILRLFTAWGIKARIEDKKLIIQ